MLKKGKIIKVTEDECYVGYENGENQVYRLEDMEFVPVVGELVEDYNGILVNGGKMKKLLAKFRNLTRVSKWNIVAAIISLILSGFVYFLTDRKLITFIAILGFSLMILFMCNMLFFIFCFFTKKRESRRVMGLYSLFYLVIFVVLALGSTTGISIDVTGIGKIMSVKSRGDSEIVIELGKFNELKYEGEEKSIDKQQLQEKTIIATISINNRKNLVNIGEYIQFEGKSTLNDKDHVMMTKISQYNDVNTKNKEEATPETTNASTTTTKTAVSPTTTTTTTSSEKDKSQYAEPDFDAWNHDELAKYKKVMVSGKVLQVSKNKDGYVLRVAMNDNFDKVIMVYIMKENTGRTIAEDDAITLYGYALGRTTYTTIMGAEKTLPLMKAIMYEN